jgi:hypothetical protein
MDNLEGIKRQVRELKKKTPSNDPGIVIVDLAAGQKIPTDLPKNTVLIVDNIIDGRAVNIEDYRP